MCVSQVNQPLKRVGTGGFKYDFSVLDETDNPFIKSYANIMYEHLS